MMLVGRGGREKRRSRRQAEKEKHIYRACKAHLSQVEGMGSFPAVLLLCVFHALTAVVQAQETEPPGDTQLPSNCREEMYPCTRMYSVHRPIKKCLGRLCLYSLPRVYVINNEICMRTVCEQDEYLKAELCRELSGWPRRIARSSSGKRCRSRHNNPKTWANKA